MRTLTRTLACSILLVASCTTSQPQPPKDAPASHAAVPALSAHKALAKLKQGNQRFVAQKQMHPDQDSKRIHELSEGQHPIATVLGCSDSRVPPEIVFDLGLGDLFVVREAGHVADDATLGSIEYAVDHLKTRLIVVLGHESCGAVTSAVEAGVSHKPAAGHIQLLIDDITPAVKKAGSHGSKESQVARAVRANVKLVVKQLSHSNPILAKAVNEKEVRVVGAVYDLHTGRVTWL